MEVDPTNANAVAGPSRLSHSASGPVKTTTTTTSSSAAASAVTRPESARHRLSSHSRAVPTTAPTNTTRKDPVRRAAGPLIVPTQVTTDGTRVVPQQFENCHLEDLITLIASMLDRLIEHNDRIPLTSNSLTRFHSRAPPNITVRDYLLRIAKYTNVEPCCLLILLPYVDKACARIASFTISSLTVHRFIIAAISVGSKALSDAFCTNGRYARVGGISVVEMNLLEKEFCEALDWRLTTSGPVLAHYYTSLVRSHPKYQLSAHEAPSPPPPAAPVSIPPPLPTSTSTSTPPSPPASKSETAAPALSARPTPSEPRLNAMQIDTPPSRAPELASAAMTPVTPAVDQGSGPGSESASCDGDPSTAPSSSTSSPFTHAPAYRSDAQRSDGSRPPSQTRSSGSGADAPPALFPPNLTRHVSDTGSNLPSPARGAEHTPPPIAGQGTGAGAAGGTSNGFSTSNPNFQPSGLRYLEGVGSTGQDTDMKAAAASMRPPSAIGAKRAHDRLADPSRSRSRERADNSPSLTSASAGGTGHGYVQERGAMLQPDLQRVGSPLAGHAGAGVRMSDHVRLGKSPRLAFASTAMGDEV